MKVKFVEINPGEKFVSKNKVVNIGDVIEVPKERGEELIKRGKVEKVKEKKETVKADK